MLRRRKGPVCAMKDPAEKPREGWKSPGRDPGGLGRAQQTRTGAGKAAEPFGAKAAPHREPMPSPLRGFSFFTRFIAGDIRHFWGPPFRAAALPLRLPRHRRPQRAWVDRELDPNVPFELVLCVPKRRTLLFLSPPASPPPRRARGRQSHGACAGQNPAPFPANPHASEDAALEGDTARLVSSQVA